MKENKKSTNVLLLIMGILILAMIAVLVGSISSFPVAAVCALISLFFAALYGFWLYKKPHGNLLKYAMLIFAAANIVADASFISLGLGDLTVHIINLLAIAAVCYGAGRLDRIKENQWIFIIADLVFLAISIMWSFSVADGMPKFMYLRLFSDPVCFSTLMIAYFVRYKDHKEAGIQDALKNSE